MEAPAHLGGHRGLHTAKLLDGPIDVVPAAGDDAQEQLHLVLRGIVELGTLEKLSWITESNLRSPITHVPECHSHTSLGSPFLCLTTLSRRKFLLAFKLSLPWHTLRPFPLILSFVPNLHLNSPSYHGFLGKNKDSLSLLFSRCSHPTFPRVPQGCPCSSPGFPKNSGCS